MNSNFKKLAREMSGVLFTWILVASIATPPALAAENLNYDSSSQAATPVAPASPPPVTTRPRAFLLEEQFNLWKEVELIDTQLDPLAKKIEDGSASESDKKRYDDLMREAAPLRQREEELRGEIGDQETLGVYTGADGEVQPATITVDKKAAEGDALTPEQQSRGSIFGAHAGAAAKDFSTQFVAFSVATGFIAMSQLMLADPSNPNALEQWEKQTFNLMGAVGFGAFMMANHGTVKLYQSLRRPGMPLAAPGTPEHDAFIKRERFHGQLANYLGMSAGMVAQTVFSDFVRDPNLMKCIRPYYDAKAKPVPGACEKLRNDWLLVDGKILQYAPAVIGMLGSTAIAQAGQMGIEKALGHVSRQSNGYLKTVFKGVRLVPKSQALRVAGKFVGQQMLGLSNFVAFLVIDSYWVEEPVNQMWQNIRENHVDLKAWADNHMGFHSEFLWPKTYQPISDALDVEATTPSTAHQYLMELYRRLQANGWKKPAPTESCVPTDIAKAAKTAKADDLKDLWFWQRWGVERSRMKSEAQLQCEVYSRPVDLLGRYGDTSKEWRGVLLSPFTSSQANWVDMIAQFTESYAASYSLANYLATQKYNQVTKGQTQPPDLSRENLAKVLNAPLPPEDDNADRPETHQSWFLDGTWIPTPELVDYVAAGSACGSEPVLTPGNDQGSMVSRAFHGVYNYIGQKQVSPNFMSTPYGSSLRFVPPKLTNQSRAICEKAPGGLYATMNYITGSHLPDLAGKDTVKNPFVGAFTDESGKKYSNLVQYAYDNLEPEMYKPTAIGFWFPNWWDEHFVKVIKPVWARYDVQYQKFIAKYYVPALFDRTYRDGCRDKDQACTDSSNAYRVSNGVFLAIETEMRNYLRGWYSLYIASLGTKAPADKKAAFMQLSNSLIAATHAIDATMIQSTAFADQAQGSAEMLKQLNALVTDALAKDTSVDAQFRKDMSAKFNDLIQKLLVEEGQDASTFHSMQFGGQRSAASVQSAPVVGPVESLDSEIYMRTNLEIPEH